MDKGETAPREVLIYVRRAADAVLHNIWHPLAHLP